MEARLPLDCEPRKPRESRVHDDRKLLKGQLELERVLLPGEVDATAWAAPLEKQPPLAAKPGRTGMAHCTSKAGWQFVGSSKAGVRGRLARGVNSFPMRGSTREREGRVCRIHHNDLNLLTVFKSSDRVCSPRTATGAPPVATGTAHCHWPLSLVLRLV